MLGKTLESPLDCKEIKPVNPKRNQPWIFIGRTDAEAPIFDHLMQGANSLKKTLKLEKNWRQEKRKTEHEMVGWYHRLNGYEFEQTQEDGERQGSVASCSPWHAKYWTLLSNWTIVMCLEDHQGRELWIFSHKYKTLKIYFCWIV